VAATLDGVVNSIPRRARPSIAIGVVLLGLVVPALIVVLVRTDHSSGDLALIELRTRDVLTVHPPITGVYSRYGWSHTGPLM